MSAIGAAHRDGGQGGNLLLRRTDWPRTVATLTSIGRTGLTRCPDTDHGGVAPRAARASPATPVQLIVLTGAGRAFCAGGKVKSMAESGESQSAADFGGSSLDSPLEAAGFEPTVPLPQTTIFQDRRIQPLRHAFPRMTSSRGAPRRSGSGTGFAPRAWRVFRFRRTAASRISKGWPRRPKA
jgi:hypothetical protein